jgi:ATP-dependent Clp protease ATP-binding subunit ClpC
VFERLTERARQVVVLAQDEARALKHNYIGTEHLLLGLLRQQRGLAARVLESLGITVEEVRYRVARMIGQGDEVTQGEIPFTPRAKKVLELSLREASALRHAYIGTEHILLGIVRENEGVAARILLDLDADAETIRSEVFRMLAGREPPDREDVSDPHAPPSAVAFLGPPERLPRRIYDPIDRRRSLLVLGFADHRSMLLLGFTLFGAAGIGVFIGWLIWG